MECDKENQALALTDEQLCKEIALHDGDHTFLQSALNDLASDECRLVNVITTTLPKIDHMREQVNTVAGFVERLQPNATTQLLTFLVNYIPEMKPNSRSLDLVPRAIERVAVMGSVPAYGANDLVVSGSDFKQALLETISSKTWPASLGVGLVDMHRDIVMTSEQLECIAAKALRHLDKLDIADTPAMIYQILLLSTKGARTMIVQGILDYFNTLDAKCAAPTEEQSVAPLRHAEGTVILKCNFAVKQDQALAKCFLACFKKNRHSVLTPFNISLMLSLARIHRYQDKVFELLKAAVLAYYAEHHRRRQSDWHKAITAAPDLPDVNRVLVELPKYASFGWDHITQGLIDFGFLLLEGGTTTKQMADAAEQVRAQGSRLLLDCFQMHAEVRGAILERILGYIVTGAATAAPYIELLSEILRSPHILKEHIPRLKKTFEYTLYLPHDVAQQLLLAASPLMRLQEFQDFIVLMLRKAMCRRESEARQVAVSGFLYLLRSSCIATTDDDGAANRLHGEVSGFLRRCLSQQPEVRQMLYSELYGIFLSNEQLRDTVLDLIVPHFMWYFETDERQPVLKLSACLTSNGVDAQVSEPLPELIQTLHRALVQQKRCDNPVDIEFVAMLFDRMTQLCSRLATAEPEDFQLDQIASGREDEASLPCSLLRLKLLLATLEVATEFCLLSSAAAADAASDPANAETNPQKKSEMLRLAIELTTQTTRYEKIEKSTNSSKKKSGAQKRGRPTQTAGAQSASGAGEWAWQNSPSACNMLSVSEMVTLLDGIDGAVAESHQHRHSSGQELSTAAAQLHSFVVESTHRCLTYLAQQHRKHKAVSIPGGDLNHMLGKMAPTLLAEFYLMRKQAANAGSDMKDCKVRALSVGLGSLDCIALSLELMAGGGIKAVNAYLDLLLQAEGTEGTEEARLSVHLSKLQDLLKELVNGGLCKEAIICCKMVIDIGSLLPAPSCAKHADHCCEIFTETDGSVQSPSLIQKLLRVWHSLSRDHTDQSDMSMLYNVAEDINQCLGAVENGVQQVSRMSMVNELTADGIALELLKILGDSLTEVEWMVGTNILNDGSCTSEGADIICSQAPPSSSQLLKIEVYNRLGSLCKIVFRLVDANINTTANSVGANAIDELFKILIKIYKLFTNLLKGAFAAAKLIVGVKKCDRTFTDRPLHALVVTMCDDLTPALYILLGNATENLKQVTLKKMPELIQNLELFDCLVISVAKWFDDDKLTNVLKHSTARDFKIELKKSEEDTGGSQIGKSKKRRKK